MKAFLTTIALAATVISAPAMAGDMTCEDGEPMVTFKTAACTKSSDTLAQNGTIVFVPPRGEAAYASAPRSDIARPAYISDVLVDTDKENNLHGGAE